ncbi:preprotein translocase subunit SecY [Candidatus Uhrbacteria bacterium RIFCSPLOWO2_01_FULL_53_9]|uniref:Protein translocase subunit SecY n=3 Tax=Candidatus Uhriibacteriota TaxID=1752732 RepID=A0A1F7UYB2_9BACT|nr:MAG: preprotein translocase subunit SecY [Candidatus Uhrbacteria bacterium RIFCSPHIGHO2_02_FULL_53_13]OGL82738.1 MAG: preprotein translocase subunit SecY [Candidatus Uhrbacteria bacterium RIFCSPLOWO2_01_FULL_53_9]OGL89088.1 MAG: preprotein translocase subunit SecY [Candidatus Uhrbacteria bacterium RIFCSPLOWO2_02_FULL_53_10]
MFEAFRRIWNIKALRKSIGFVILMLMLFRFLATIPVPGIDPALVRSALEGNQFFGLLNIFSGGTLESFSVVALGVAPYITSSIIFQLLVMVVPSLKRMQKEEGEAGRQKMNQITRWVSVPLAAIQAYGFIALISQGSGGGAGQGLLIMGFSLFMAMLVMIAGSVFLMWIGEIITEKGIGNGLSILILAGIIAAFPRYLQQTIATFDQSQIVNMVVFAIVALVTIVVVVALNEASRNVPVHYARHHAGNRLSGGVNSQIPLKVLMAGVIPIIFAISVVLFPTMIAQFFLHAQSPTLITLAEWVLRTFQNNWVYGILYFVLVFGFTYFYTGVIFQPDEMAENLQKQGAFIPGVRPGTHTEAFLRNVMNRILLLGATALAVIAVLPVAMQPLTGSQTLVVGGTSLLIIVAVVIDIVRQTEARLVSYEYEQL